MTITITGAQRDLLWEEFVVLLTGIDSLMGAVYAKDFERGAELGRVYGDALTFVGTDLGWGPGSGDPIELRTDPAIVRRVMGYFRDKRALWQRLEQSEATSLSDAVDRSHFLMETCDEVLRELDDKSAD